MSAVAWVSVVIITITMREARPVLLYESETRFENLFFESGYDPFGGSACSTWKINFPPYFLIRNICWSGRPLLKCIVFG